MALQNPTALAQRRRQLEERATALRSEVKLLRSEAPGGVGRDQAGNVEDTGAKGEEHTRDAVRDVELLRDTEELQDIAAARQRLNDGTYGECIDCGCDIPPARLAVQPAAARCVPCQERFERGAPALAHRAAPDDPSPAPQRGGPPEADDPR